MKTFFKAQILRPTFPTINIGQLSQKATETSNGGYLENNSANVLIKHMACDRSCRQWQMYTFRDFHNFNKRMKTNYR